MGSHKEGEKQGRLAAFLSQFVGLTQLAFRGSIGDGVDYHECSRGLLGDTLAARDEAFQRMDDSMKLRDEYVDKELNNTRSVLLITITTSRSFRASSTHWKRRPLPWRRRTSS